MTEDESDYFDTEKEHQSRGLVPVKETSTGARYKCRHCNVSVSDETALILHIKSRQHLAKLVEKEEETIVLDGEEEEGVEKEKKCRKFYPKHEEEFSFANGGTEVGFVVWLTFYSK